MSQQGLFGRPTPTATAAPTPTAKTGAQGHDGAASKYADKEKREEKASVSSEPAAAPSAPSRTPTVTATTTATTATTTRWVICPRTATGSMDAEEVAWDAWEGPARRMAASTGKAVDVFEIDGQGRWGKRGGMSAPVDHRQPAALQPASPRSVPESSS